MLLYDEEVLSLQMQLRLLISYFKVRRLSWIVQLTQYNHKGPLNVEEVGRRSESKGDLKMLCVGFEERQKDYEPRHVHGLQKLEEARKQILSYSLQKQCSLLTLILPRLLTSRTINAHGFSQYVGDNLFQ